MLAARFMLDPAAHCDAAILRAIPALVRLMAPLAAGGTALRGARFSRDKRELRAPVEAAVGAAATLYTVLLERGPPTAEALAAMDASKAWPVVEAAAASLAAAGVRPMRPEEAVDIAAYSAEALIAAQIEDMLAVRVVAADRGPGRRGAGPPGVASAGAQARPRSGHQ